MRVYRCCEECDGRTCEHMDVCMCGCEMSAHSLWSGHAAVSMHDYYSKMQVVLDWGPFMEAMAYSAALSALAMVPFGMLDYFSTCTVLAHATMGFMLLYFGGAYNNYREWSEW